LGEEFNKGLLVGGARWNGKGGKEIPTPNTSPNRVRAKGGPGSGKTGLAGGSFRGSRCARAGGAKTTLKRPFLSQQKPRAGGLGGAINHLSWHFFFSGPVLFSKPPAPQPSGAPFKNSFRKKKNPRALCGLRAPARGNGGRLGGRFLPGCGYFCPMYGGPGCWGCGGTGGGHCGAGIAWHRGPPQQKIIPGRTADGGDLALLCGGPFRQPLGERWVVQRRDRADARRA